MRVALWRPLRRGYAYLCSTAAAYTSERVSAERTVETPAVNGCAAPLSSSTMRSVQVLTAERRRMPLRAAQRTPAASAATSVSESSAAHCWRSTRKHLHAAWLTAESGECTLQLQQKDQLQRAGLAEVSQHCCSGIRATCSWTGSHRCSVLTAAEAQAQSAQREQQTHAAAATGHIKRSVQ
ncbi:hypothetical protein KOW79_013519 [Hemibagrus wyckioides]|uniref:Uncharacterized protein n=1 Tax=Hemibagrus wyckioides TaxID=337641 RepID=A0A9D3NKA3_9TELE|nr:hypothetical protein KOW79_013519 [Hemibagrus wyckioides]